MNDIEKFKSYNLAGTTYDYINCYVVHEHEFVGINLHGNLNDENCEYKHFNILIGGIKSPIPVERIDKYQEGILKNIAVEGSEEDGFHERLSGFPQRHDPHPAGRRRPQAPAGPPCGGGRQQRRGRILRPVP